MRGGWPGLVDQYCTSFGGARYANYKENYFVAIALGRCVRDRHYSAPVK